MNVSYPFVASDAGRAESRRPRQKNDCTVRALTHVTSLAYDDVYDRVAELGRKSHRGFDLRKHAEAFGLVWRPFQAVKGQKRMTPVQFAREYPEGRWIVRTAGHVFAFIDGVGYDEDPERDDRCIYGAWEYKP